MVGAYLKHTYTDWCGRISGAYLKITEKKDHTPGDVN